MTTDKKRLAHIPDRDQVFHDLGARTPSEAAEDHRSAWSGDLEAKVKGDRDLRHEADEEILAVAPPLAATRAGAEHFSKRRQRTVSAGTAPPLLAASDLAQLARALVERRHDLERLVVAHQQYFMEQIAPADAGESTVDFNHPADMVHADPDYERELMLVGRERAELTLVNQALSRIEEGAYGSCEECGAVIPISRLYAVPFAKYCLACQSGDEDVISGGAES